MGIYAGEIWKTVANFEIGKDKDWVYSIWIMKGEWTQEREILWIRKWRH